MQPTESDAVPGAPRLRQVAVASVEAAMAECEWETALEHLFTAMELTPRGDRAIGTLHAQCCECCLRLVSTKERDAYNVRYCDSALEHSETAVRLWPDWAEAYAGRAAALEACGRLLEACDEYRHAIALAEDEGREETAEASGKEGAPLLAKLRGALEAATTKLADSEARDQLR
jgi:tetratricopeptide (TPR) repeat protein